MANFNYNTLRKKRKKKESAFRMKLHVKVRGLSVWLSHVCWRPRILLYNGLSTFFYYNIIYLNFPLTKQNSDTTDQQCQNGLSASSLCLFCLNCMNTLDGKVFRVHFMQGHSQSSMYSHRSFS